MIMTKQVIILNMEADMGIGRLCAQGAHASIAVLLDMGDWSDRNSFEIAHVPHDVQYWMKESFTKIVVKAWGNEPMQFLYDLALSHSLPTSRIEEDGVITAVAVGPAEINRIDQVTGNLTLL